MQQINQPTTSSGNNRPRSSPTRNNFSHNRTETRRPDRNHYDRDGNRISSSRNPHRESRPRSTERRPGRSNQQAARSHSADPRPRRNRPHSRRTYNNQSISTPTDSPKLVELHPGSHSHLKVCTLSGTNEVGRNCNFIELGNDILIIDCGFSFPGQELYGIDYLIPNFKYLKKNKHKIRGMLITHGHLDHTGALPYVLPEIGFPTIYGGRFANALISDRLKEFDMQSKAKFQNVDRNTEIQLGQFKVKFIGVTHSIPNAFSIFIESPKGNVFFSGDYKIDMEPANEPETDYPALEALRGKVDLALMESTNSKSEGKAKSETEIAGNLERVISQHNGRIIVAAFSSLVSRLYSVIKIAQKSNRKVVLAGRSIRQALMIARDQGYIDVPEGIFIRETSIRNFPDNQILMICSGSQGERFSALNRISLGEHKAVKIKPNDMVILSASEIPTNIVQIERMTDRLIKQGAEIIQNDFERVHESGHALKVDMKMMHEMVQPKEVIPIHGSLTMRYKNKRNYMAWGMSDERVHLTEDGQTWIFSGGTWKRGQPVESKPILIDGLGIGDIGDVVLKDRQQLAEFGMVTVILNISSKSKHLIGRPKFLSRGFVYVKTSQEMFKQMEMTVQDLHREWVRRSNQQRRFDEKELISDIEKELSKYIYSRTEREPMILTMIV